MAVPAPSPLDDIARAYVRLVLAVGHHDADYVDAYYGPEELRQEVDAAPPSLDDIRSKAAAALQQLARAPGQGEDELPRLRHTYLRRQLEALVSRVAMLQGRAMGFDEESRALYDAVAPTFTAEHFETILGELSSVLPQGSGAVHERYERFRQAFVIPKERLDLVFTAAIAEARSRTREHIALPEGEHFTVEYVTGKSWSGYNWYQGNSRSLIQMNTDFPITIDRAVDLASHEGYPGHHVYNTLLERSLVRERGWVEFSVYALFSPQSLVAEGTANYGIAMAFPAQERAAFERGTLFPLAGLDPAQAETYARIHALSQKLAYAGNEAARGYLDGRIGRDEAAAWLVRYALMSPERAMQRTRFFDQYRSYVINYNLGQDLVQQYVEGRGGTPEHPEARWEIFRDLLSSPRLPSSLTA